MKQTEARALFPNHKLKFSLAKHLQFGDKFVMVMDAKTEEVLATVNLESTKVVVCITRKPKRKSDIPHYVAFAEVASYKAIHEVQKAMDAERKHDGLGPVEWEDARKQFQKVREQDFDFGIELLAIYFGVLAGKHPGFTREQFPFMTTKGKRIYREACALSEGPARFDKPVEKEATEFKGFASLQLPTAPVTSPVTQAAKTLHEGKAKRAERDQRTVWGAEDDEIFALVEHDHKVLSDRLAALYSARGSKISIPEFDRRRKAAQEAKQNG
jgi:hypothetical protein